MRVVAHRDAQVGRVGLDGICDRLHHGVGSRPDRLTAAQPRRRLVPRSVELVVGSGLDPVARDVVGEARLEEPWLDDRDLDAEVADLEVESLAQGLERELRTRLEPVERRGDAACE